MSDDGSYFSRNCSALECSSFCGCLFDFLEQLIFGLLSQDRAHIFLATLERNPKVIDTQQTICKIRLEIMSKANIETEVNNKRLAHNQLSIQPNIPSKMVLGRSDSRRLVSQKASPTFPTKTLRMKSLLWTKPTGFAVTSMSSTIKQVSCLLFRIWCCLAESADSRLAGRATADCSY